MGTGAPAVESCSMGAGAGTCGAPQPKVRNRTAVKVADTTAEASILTPVDTAVPPDQPDLPTSSDGASVSRTEERPGRSGLEHWPSVGDTPKLGRDAKDLAAWASNQWRMVYPYLEAEDIDQCLAYAAWRMEERDVPLTTA